MKKFISFLIFLSCFVGSAWGQVSSVNIIIPPTHVSCFGANDGSLKATIVATGNIDISLRKAGQTDPVKTINNTTLSEVEFNGLGPGSYNVRVCPVGSTSGCRQSSTVVITEPDEILTNVVTTQGQCTGTKGKVEVSVGGGTPAYKVTLTLNGVPDERTTNGARVTFDNLEAGTYTLTVVDSKGCQPAQPIPPINIKDLVQVTGEVIYTKRTSCFGGTDGIVEAIALTGATGIYYMLDGDRDNYHEINFDNGIFEDLPAGPHYIIIGDDNECFSDPINFTIAQPTSAVSATITDLKNIETCPGNKEGKFKITGIGGTKGVSGSEYSYSIDNGSSFPEEGLSAVFENLAAGTYNIVVTDSNKCEYRTTQIITEPVVIDFTLSPTPNKCAAGTEAKIDVVYNKGGTAPIQYQLEKSDGTILVPYQTGTSFTGLAAGSYVVRSRDAKNCLDNRTVAITDPTKVVITASAEPVKCNGDLTGSITVTAQGGDNTSYTYSIDSKPAQASNKFTGLGKGTYSVVAYDAQGCASDPLSVTISEPDPLVVSATPAKTTCNNMTNPDGAITVTVQGGVAPYTYSLDGITFQTENEFKDLAPNTYTVTVKDGNDCEATVTVVVEESLGITITSVTQDPDPLACYDDEAVLTVNVTSEPGRDLLYSFNGLWGTSNTLTAVGGFYNIKVKYAQAPWDACAEASTTYQLIQPDPIYFIYSVEAVKCNGGSDGSITITATGGTGPKTYSLSGVGVNIQDQASNKFEGLKPGKYTVIVKDSQGCSDTKTDIEVGDVAAIKIDSESHTDVACTGGNDGTITVTASGGTGTLVYSLDGGATTQTTGSFTGLTAGTYTVTVIDANKCSVKVENIVITEPVAIVFTAKAKDEQIPCVGTTTEITVTISSPASGDFRYKISGRNWQTQNKFENIGPGTYIVQVAYAGTINCTSLASQTVVIKDATVIDFELDSIPNKCNGASDAQIKVTYKSGGVSPIQYRLDGPKTVDYQSGTVFSGLKEGNYSVTARDANKCTVTKSIEIEDPKAIIIDSENSTNILCNGGSTGTITIRASGGTAPLVYTISPNAGSQLNPGEFTGLPKGTYTISITDKSLCGPVTKVITLTEPDALVAVFDPKDVVQVSCFGDNTGSAKVTVTGGTIPYSYTWDKGITSTGPEATGLKADTYTVTVTDNAGCTVTRSVQITEPGNALTLDIIERKDITCAGLENGIIEVQASGGTPQYKYIWNGLDRGSVNRETALAEGFYNITVIDANGCRATQSNIHIAAPLPIQATFTKDNISCNGLTDGSAKITASGGTVAVPGGYKYLWSTGAKTDAISGLAAGTYTVDVTDDNDCTTQFSVTITEPDVLVVTMDNPTNVSCKGNTDGKAGVTVTGGTGAPQYSWTGPDGFTASTREIENLKAGTYTVTVTDTKGCTAAPVSVTITEPVDIIVVKIETGNPTCANEETTLTITATGDSNETLVYSIDGVNWQIQNTFTVLGANTYMVSVGYKVSETQAKCIKTSSITVPGRAAIVINKIDGKLMLECNETSTVITIDATSGEGNPNNLRYSVGKGWQTSNTFTLTPGSYYPVCVQYADEPSCPVCLDDPLVVDQNIDISISKVEVTGDMDCSDSKASITITAQGDGRPLEYSIGNGWFASPQFNDVPAGTYPVSVRYAGELCARIWGDLEIKAPKAITFQSVVVGATSLPCSDSHTTVDIVADGEPGRIIEYSIDGTNWQTSGSFDPVYPGDYQVQARYQSPAPACQVPGQAIKISAPEAIKIISAVAFRPNLSCFNDTTSITIHATGENGYTLEYSIDGGSTWSTTPRFTDLTEGDYQVVVRYKGQTPSCSVNGPLVEITAPDEIIINSAVAEKDILDCSGPGSTTKITIIATGSGNMEYSIDGINWYPSNVIGNVTAGSYIACVRYIGTDCKTCDTGNPVVIRTNSSINDVQLTADKTQLNCGEKAVLSVTVDPTSSDYEYSINGSGWKDFNSFDEKVEGGNYVIYIRDKNDPSCIQPSNTLFILQPMAVQIISVKVDEAECNGDGADVTVVAYGDDIMTFTLTGGTSPLTSNNGKFTGVAPGTYTLDVKYTNPAFNLCSETYPDPIVITEPDLITIDNAYALVTELKCAGSTTKLYIDATGSKAMEYSIDGTNWQDSNEFEVGAGSYTAQVRYKTTSPNKCTVIDNNQVVITEWAPITITVDVADLILECGQNTTTIKITAQGEAGKAFDFRVKDTDSWVSNGTNEFTFTVPAGSYQPSVRYQENTSCIVSSPVTIDQNIDISIDNVIIGQQNLDCFDGTTTITIDATGDGRPLEYSIRAGEWQTNNLFNNVTAGDYNVQVRYAGENCAKQYGLVKITAPDEIRFISVTPKSPVDLACPEDRTTISVDATGSKAMEYSVVDGIWQDAPVFSNLGAGSYTVRVRYKDSGKCEVTYVPAIDVFQPAGITITSIDYTANLDCSDNTTTITINATGEQKAGFNLEYSIDGGTTWQSSKDFLHQGKGTYQPRVRYSGKNCAEESAPDFTISAPDKINIKSALPVTSPLACGATTRILVDVEADPSLSLQYSLDGTTWVNNANNLPEVGVGSYTLYVRYAAPASACQAEYTGSVASSSTIQNVVATADKTNLGCDEGTVIRTTVGSYDNAKQLQYRINGSAWGSSPDFNVPSGGRYIIEVSYVGEEACVQPSNEVFITQPDPISILSVAVDYGKTALDCYNDKTNITINVNADFTQQIVYTLIVNGTPVSQTNNNKFEVGAGTYSVEVSYAGGICKAEYNRTIVITQPDQIQIGSVTLGGPIECQGGTTTLTIVATGDPNRSLEYSADGINWQSGSQITVSPGFYDQIQVRYKQPEYPSCSVISPQTFTVAEPDSIEITHVSVDKSVVDCSTNEKATIIVNAFTSSGRTIEYSFDGGNTWQAGNSFQATPKSYRIFVRFANAPNCPKEYKDVIVIGSNSNIAFSNVAVTQQVTCDGTTGSINATVVAAVNNLQMSIDEGTSWINIPAGGTSHLFENLVTGTYYVWARTSDQPDCIVVSDPKKINAPAQVIISEITKTPASGCDTGSEMPGSVTIAVSGGTAPYEYLLDGTWYPFSGNTVVIPNLKSGTYTIGARDANQCEAIQPLNVSIENYDLIKIDVEVNNIRCFGEANGQLTIKVSQGHAPYTVTVKSQALYDNGIMIAPAYNQTFTINNSSEALVITDLYANDYMITVKDGKCEKSQEVRIKQPQGPLIADYQGHNICPNDTYGSIYPQTFGGWPDYISYWYKEQTAGLDDYKPMYPDGSGNAIGGKVPDLGQISAGKYAIVVVDQAFCSDTSYVEIIAMTPLKVDDIKTYGVCNASSLGAIKIVNPQGGANGYYVYRVRYQSSGSVVPGFDYQEWPNDSIPGLPQGTYIVDMKDHQGMGCPPETFQNIVIGTESGISIDHIVVTDPKCWDGNDGLITDIKVSGVSGPFQYKLKYPNGVEIGWQASAKFDTISVGNYTVYVREDARGCEASKDTLISGPPQLEFKNIILDEPACEKDPQGVLKFDVSGGTGNLTVTYNGVAMTGTLTDPSTNTWHFEKTLVKGGKAIIEAIDQNGCSDTIMRDIPYTTDLEIIQADIVPNECPDDKIATITVLAKDKLNAPHGQFVYELYEGEATDPGKLVKSITQATLTDPVVFDQLANGKYTISVHDDRLPNPCYTLDSIVMVTNTSNIELTNIQLRDNSCNGKNDGSIIFTIKGDPANTSYDFEIDGKDRTTVPAVNGIASSAYAINLSSGDHILTVYYGNCSVDHPFTIKAAHVVTPVITVDPVIGCIGSANGAINITMSDINGIPYRYWYSGLAADDFQSFTSTFNTRISGLSGGDYKVVVSENGGCLSDTIKVNVPEAEGMKADFTPTTPITCIGQLGEGTITISGGVAPYQVTVTEYPPYAPAPQISGSGSVFTIKDVTGGTYKLSVSDNGSCTEIVELKINAPRTVTMDVLVTEICDPANATGKASIQIDVTRPAPDPSNSFEYFMNGMTIPSSNSTYVFNNLDGGLYNVRVKDTKDGCLADTTLFIKERPTLTITEDRVALGDCEFEINLTLIPGNSMDAPFEFSMDGGPFQSSNIFNNVAAGSHTFLVRDAGGCTGEPVSYQVSKPQPIHIDISDSGDPTCNADPKGYILLDGLNTYKYEWTNVNDPATVLSKSKLLKDVPAGNYNVHVTNSDGSCSIDSVFTVAATYYVHANMLLVGHDPANTVCPGTELVFQGSITDGKGNDISNSSGVSGRWEYPDGTSELFQPLNPVLEVPKPVTGEYKFFAMVDIGGGQNCQSDTAIMITTTDVPTLSLPEKEIYIPRDATYSLRATVGDFAGSYDVSWSSKPAGYTDDTWTNLGPFDIQSDKDPYLLTVTVTANGCAVSDSIKVKRSLDIVIPNVFTPNDDGNHDLWVFRYLEQYLDYYPPIEVNIFNRAGVQVYSGKGYNNSSVVFNGRYNGNDLPIGAYYYVVKIGAETYTGSVSILR